MLGVDIEMLENKVKNNMENLSSMFKDLKELKESLYTYEARDIINNADSKIICAGFTEKTLDEVQSLGRIILQEGSFLLIVFSEIDNKLWFAHDGNMDINCGKVFKESLGKYNGRGGGSDKQAQAAFTDTKSLLEFFDFLYQKYKL
jgi:alanyl-tRNA synthetase